MTKLLRLEFRRLFKDKSFLAVSIIIVAIALLQIVVASSSYYIDPYTHEIDWFMTLKDIISVSFQVSSTPFILIGLFLSLFIAKDINQGTIRNKLIAGYSKVEIYVAMAITSLVISLVGMMIYHAVIMSFIWLIPFPVDANVAHDLENFLIYWAVGYFLILVVTSFVTFIAMMIKNMAGAIIVSLVFLTFIVGFALLSQALFEMLIMQQFDLYSQAQEAEDARRALNLVLDYFLPYQLLKYSTSFFNPTDYTNFYSTEGTQYLFKVLGTNIVLLAGLNVGGAFLFSKTDLK